MLASVSTLQGNSFSRQYESGFVNYSRSEARRSAWSHAVRSSALERNSSRR